MSTDQTDARKILQSRAKAEYQKALEAAESTFRARMEAIDWMFLSRERGEPRVLLFEPKTQSFGSMTEQGESKKGDLFRAVTEAVAGMPNTFSVADLSKAPQLASVNRNSLGSAVQRLVKKQIIAPAGDRGMYKKVT